MKVKSYISETISSVTDTCFSIPGDYNLPLLDSINKTKVQHIHCTNELNMAYTADGYARTTDFAVFVTTFSVGGLSAINGVAGSYAENCPVLHISCGPKQSKEHVFHHTIGEVDVSYVEKIYNNITVFSKRVVDPTKVPYFLSKAIKYIKHYKKPAYIEIPSNILDSEIGDVKISNIRTPKIEISVLDKSLYEKAKNPIIVLGKQLGRFEDLPCPVCCLPNAKGYYNEESSSYLGIYWEGISDPGVKEAVSKSDLVIYLGCLLNDYNTCGFTNKTQNSVMIDNIGDLQENMWVSRKEKTKSSKKSFCLETLTEIVNKYITSETTIVAETGTSWMTCLGMKLKENTKFEIQMQYGSIGWSLGASLGCYLGNPKNMVMLFIGDGSFQMTAQEVSTMLRYNMKGIIFLINNKGYVIEDAIHKGEYNKFQNWDYSSLFESLGGKNIETITSVKKLSDCLDKAYSKRDLYFFNCIISNDDIQKNLIKWGKSVGKFNKS